LISSDGQVRSVHRRSPSRPPASTTAATSAKIRAAVCSSRISDGAISPLESGRIDAQKKSVRRDGLPEYGRKAQAGSAKFRVEAEQAGLRRRRITEPQVAGGPNLQQHRLVVGPGHGSGTEPGSVHVLAGELFAFVSQDRRDPAPLLLQLAFCSLAFSFETPPLLVAQSPRHAFRVGRPVKR